MITIEIATKLVKKEFWGEIKDVCPARKLTVTSVIFTSEGLYFDGVMIEDVSELEQTLLALKFSNYDNYDFKIYER